MTRILVWFWSGGGGGSQFAAHLAHKLTARFGSDRVALSMRADDPTIESAEARGVRVLRADVVSDRKRPLQTLAGLYHGRDALRTHIATAGAEVVCLAMNFAAAAPLSLSLDRPLVYCAHDPEPHPGDFSSSMQRVTQALLLHRADAVVALSQFAANRLELKKAVRGKLRLAPLSSVFAPTSDPPPLQHVPVRLLMMGRMMAYKGLSLLAEALPTLASRDDWRLSVVGAGPAFAEGHGLLAHMAQVDVHEGWLTEAETDALIDAHDIVLAPYIEASQSGVVAQALARGRPVIATPVGALAEQIQYGAAGWLAEAVTPQAFAAATAAALANTTQRAEKSAAALALAQGAWASGAWDWIGDPTRR